MAKDSSKAPKKDAEAAAPAPAPQAAEIQHAQALQAAHQQAPVYQGRSEWMELSAKFERWGRAGIAAAIGLSAAGLFCRLADQGKVNVPILTGLVLNRPGVTPQQQAPAQDASAPAEA